VLEAPPRYPLKGGVLVSNRGRVDARFIDGEYSWRFRSRLSVEKEFSIGPVRMNPYVRGELFSDSRFGKWSRTEWIGGSGVSSQPAAAGARRLLVGAHRQHAAVSINAAV
jgi:hypothetical protein